MASPCQITDNLVQKLSSSSIYSIKKALAIVAKLTKRSNEANLFREKGGLNKLIALLKRPNNSIIDMAMSAIANCSMFEECKIEVRNLDGIQPIVSVLKNLKSISIRNRAARALANLAENEQNAMVIEELAAIEELVKLLNETTDADCQQTVLRSLKILSTTPERKKIVYEQGGLKTMVELLKSDKPVIINCSIKAISEVTKNCSKEVAQKIQEFDGIKEIIKLTSCVKSSVSSAAFMTVVNLCVHAHVRVSIGSEGGIDVLYKQAEMNLSSHVTLKAVEGLCYCCREAVNRNRVYECGGIELLLRHLSSSEHSSLHRKIITAFNCFYYSEKCLELLLNNGIVAVLLTYLKKLISSCCSINHSEEDSDPFDHESFTSDFSSPSESPRSTLSTPDNNSNIACNETFLEEAENLAMKVRDAKESRVLTFKRKSRTRLLSSTPPTVKTIDQSPSLFSFSSLQSITETTSVMNTCTLSSTSVTSRPTALHSFPQGLICSTPMAKDISDTDTSSKESSSDAAATKHELTSTSFNPKESCINFGSLYLSETSTNTVANSILDSPTRLMSQHVKEENTERNMSPSALSTPPKKERTQVPHQTFHGQGHSALLLLSRFSHMSDQNGLPYLLTKQCISTLLDYLCLLDNPSPKCTRLLNRLTLDPQCFEDLVGMGMPCDVHRQLCCGYTEGYTYMDSQETHDNDTSYKNENTISGDVKSDVLQPLQIQIPYNSIVRCRSIGKQLMENLACQSQTPFGKGVLMHLLAKGSGEDWLGCVLTLPLVCRSGNLRNEMLIKKHGLKMLCDLLVSTSNGQVLAKVVNSLTALSSSIELPLHLSATLTESCQDQKVGGNQVQTGKRKFDIKISSHSPSHSQTKRQKLDFCSSSCENGLEQAFFSSNDEISCEYVKNQGPHDIQLRVDTGEIIPVHRRKLIDTSEVFAAMLSPNYKEGSMLIVPIQEVSFDTLTCIIHHGYGCTFPIPQGKTKSSETCSHLQAIFSSHNTDSLFQFMIEMVAIADRFLMAKLKMISEEVLKTLVTESNIVSLCLSAAHYHSNTLCEFGLKFLLLKIPDLQFQYNSFRQIFKSNDKLKLITILYELLLQQMEKQKVV